MSSTCQTMHYDASHVHNTRNTKVAMARAALCVVLCAHCCILYTGQCPPQDTSLEVYLPPYVTSSHAPPFLISFAPSLPPSSTRFIPQSPLSFAPSIPTFLPHSFPSSTYSPLPPSLPPILHPASLLPCHPPCLPVCQPPPYN